MKVMWLVKNGSLFVNPSGSYTPTIYHAELHDTRQEAIAESYHKEESVERVEVTIRRKP